MTKMPMKITKDLSPPVAAGKYHRVICMTGKNKGLCYYLSEPRIVMGRGSQVGIQVLDNQASREHVELMKVGSDYILTDLGSQNGVIVNDLDVKQHKLKNGDKIIIGSSVFKYSYLEIVPENLPEVVDEDEDDEDDEEVGSSSKNKSKSKKAPKKGKNQPKKKGFVIYLVVALIGVMFLLPENNNDNQNIKKEDAKPRVFLESGKKESTKKTVLEKEIQEKVEAYIHRGRREAREGNYFRAMEEFSLALMLDPNSGDAAFHMNRAKQRLDEQIEVLFLQATKYKDSLKRFQAMMTYCSIVKLLKDYPDDERYKEASKNVKDMATKLDKEASESQCY